LLRKASTRYFQLLHQLAAVQAQVQALADLVALVVVLK
jgi:hypothetical protein